MFYPIFFFPSFLSTLKNRNVRHATSSTFAKTMWLVDNTWRIRVTQIFPSGRSLCRHSRNFWSWWSDSLAGQGHPWQFSSASHWKAADIWMRSQQNFWSWWPWHSVWICHSGVSTGTFHIALPGCCQDWQASCCSDCTRRGQLGSFFLQNFIFQRFEVKLWPFSTNWLATSIPHEFCLSPQGHKIL